MARRTTREAWKSRLIFGVAGGVVRPLMNAILGRTWRNMRSIPSGSLIVANHVSAIDPLVVAHAVYSNGLFPRFLAKKSLFEIPVVGKVLQWTGQIPVDRGGPGAKSSLLTASEVLGRGGVIIIYPEGTLTKDPEQWPMTGRTGAARLALKTGAPVIPVAHWGDQELIIRDPRKMRIFPRKRTVVSAGAPVDLEDLREGPLTRSNLEEATHRIMDELTNAVVELRGEPAPALRWDPREDSDAQLAQRASHNPHAGEDAPADGNRD